MKKNSITLTLFFILINTSSIFSQKYERYKKLNDIIINSKYLGIEKKISITVPLEWQKNSNQEFPLMIIFDQQNNRSHHYIMNTIDYLTSNQQIPSFIIVSVTSEQAYRYNETQYKISDMNGLASENEKFIFEELIILLENDYNASKFRLFIGHSRYGFFTTSVFCTRIDELNAVISMSPFFTQEKVDLTEQMNDLNTKSLKFKKYFRYGIGNDYPEDYDVMTSLINNTIKNPYLDLKGSFFKEADHNSTPGLLIANSLYEIFENWYHFQMQYLSNDQTDLQIKTALEDKILENYGVAIKFSLGILNGKAWSFYNAGEYKTAIQAWEILLESYPNFSETYLYIIEAKKQLKEDYSGVILQFEKSLEDSEFYTITQKKELEKALKDILK